MSEGMKRILSAYDHLTTLQRVKVDSCQSKSSSQWNDLVGRFTVSYNESTIPKYQITEKRMAMKLAPILKAEGIGYLEYFYNECAKKDNFGRWFNWSLNSRNVK